MSYSYGNGLWQQVNSWLYIGTAIPVYVMPFPSCMLVQKSSNSYPLGLVKGKFCKVCEYQVEAV